MNPRKWLLLILCTGCLLVVGCTAEEGLTASGSDGWSRGTVVGTAADEVTVAVWEDTTFVAWVAGSGQLRLAWLDAALGLQGVTDMALGLVLVGTFVSHGRLPGWKAVAWLGAAAVLQLVCRRFLFPSLMVLGPDPVEIGLSLAPSVLGAGLMWVYWRRAEEPLLVAAYGLFAGMDAIFSLFVLMPRLVWGA
jgi:hypothetical protein